MGPVPGRQPARPGNQNQTDDFTGFIAHSSNLALKGIVGIAVDGRRSPCIAGNSADAASYATTAKSYISTWVANSQDGQHLRLAYDQPGTWSLKYNGFPDRLAQHEPGLSGASQAEEAAWYASRSRAPTACCSTRGTPTPRPTGRSGPPRSCIAVRHHRNTLITGIYNFANRTGNRVPFTDWYTVATPHRTGSRIGLSSAGSSPTDPALRAHGLRAYWGFDSSDSYDSSGNFQDGILAGGAGYTSGMLGGAISLDGSTA